MRAGRVFQKYFLPGFVFQSVVIAGGYGTGRELVEFFLVYGPVGGLLAMVLVSMVVWSAVCAVSFEFSRRFRTFDYRHFFQRLLGRGWIAYELCYLVMLLLVLAVIAAAAGTILQELFGLPYAVGVAAIMAAVGLVVLGGTTAVERALATWSFVLYGAYVVFILLCFAQFGDAIGASLRAGEVRSGWAVGGIRYAAYNLAIIPAILFVVRHAERRSEAVTAGLLAGPIAMIPAILFYLAMIGQYPAVLDRPVPANFLLDLLGSRGFQLAFQLILFGTLIETGAGFIHAVNERIAGVYEERGGGMPAALRPGVAIFLLLLGTGLAQFGLIDLIARGYGTLTWLFLAVYVVPVLTVGLVKLRRAGRTGARSPADVTVG